jgi:argininosuccinate lyase
LAGHDLSPVLDPRLIVLTRSAQGGAAPDALHAMVESCRAEAGALHAQAATWKATFDQAEAALLASARAIADTKEEVAS